MTLHQSIQQKIETNTLKKENVLAAVSNLHTRIKSEENVFLEISQISQILQNYVGVSF